MGQTIIDIYCMYRLSEWLKGKGTYSNIDEQTAQDSSGFADWIKTHRGVEGLQSLSDIEIDQLAITLQKILRKQGYDHD